MDSIRPRSKRITPRDRLTLPRADPVCFVIVYKFFIFSKNVRDVLCVYRRNWRATRSPPKCFGVYLRGKRREENNNTHTRSRQQRGPSMRRPWRVAISLCACTPKPFSYRHCVLLLLATHRIHNVFCVYMYACRKTDIQSSLPSSPRKKKGRDAKSTTYRATYWMLRTTSLLNIWNAVRRPFGNETVNDDSDERLSVGTRVAPWRSRGGDGVWCRQHLSAKFHANSLFASSEYVNKKHNGSIITTASVKGVLRRSVAVTWHWNYKTNVCAERYIVLPYGVCVHCIRMLFIIRISYPILCDRSWSLSSHRHGVVWFWISNVVFSCFLFELISWFLYFH